MMNVKVKYGLISQKGKIELRENSSKTGFDKLLFELKSGYDEDYYISNLKNNFYGLFDSGAFISMIANRLTDQDILILKINKESKTKDKTFFEYEVGVIKKLGKSQREPHYNVIDLKSVYDHSSGRVDNYIMKGGKVVSRSFDTARFVIRGLSNIRISYFEIYNGKKLIESIELSKQRSIEL